MTGKKKESWEKEFLELLDRPSSNFSNKNRWLLDWVKALLFSKRKKTIEKIRIGHCTITGKEVHVEPLQPAERSGQPKECTDHFVLRKSYR
jgi:hypothetical protein